MISAGKTIEVLVIIITQANVNSVFIEQRSRLAKILNCEYFLTHYS